MQSVRGRPTKSTTVQNEEGARELILQNTKVKDKETEKHVNISIASA
jgi:hypothetical protein